MADSPEFSSLVSFSWTRLVAGFLILVLIVGIGLTAFNYGMRRLAHDRVQEANALLNGPVQDRSLDDAPRPYRNQIRTLRAHQYDLIQSLMNARDRRSLDDQLEERYRDQMMTYDLPADWRQQLPAELEAWKQQQEDTYARQLAGIHTTVKELAETTSDLENRVNDLRSDSVPEGFEPYRERSVQFFQGWEGTLNDALDVLSEDPERHRLTEQQFDRVVDVSDSITDLVQHLYRLQALEHRWSAWIQAERTYRDALRFYPQYAPAHRGLGDLYRQAGFNQVADHFYRQAVRIQPGGEMANEVEERFRSRLDSTDSPWAQYNLAYLHHQRGRTNKARERLEQIKQSSRADVFLRALTQQRLQLIDDGIPPYSKGANY